MPAPLQRIVRHDSRALGSTPRKHSTMTLGRLVSIGAMAGFASLVPACDEPYGGGAGLATGSGGSGAAAGGGFATGGEGASGAAGEPEFELLWKDEFDTLDAARWGTASHSFAENLSQFTPANVSTEGGFLKLALRAAPEGGDKPYLGAEVRTVQEFTYGRFETRARFASGSGLVSSLFTFYDHLPMNWNEIDIEFLGQYGDRVQYNTIFWNEAQARLAHEHLDVLTFDPSADFHVYTIDWLPGEVRFSVDGVLRHTETEGIAQFMTLPQKLMMNLWPANIPAWAGPVDPAAIPAESQYDWVAIYSLVP